MTIAATRLTVSRFTQGVSVFAEILLSALLWFGVLLLIATACLITQLVLRWRRARRHGLPIRHRKGVRS